VNPFHLFLGTRSVNIKDMWRKKRGARPPVHIGAAHPQTPFTNADVRRIRRICATGRHQSRLAREYGVSPAAINAIVRRKTWTHI
jgi:hypothetical protein